MACNKKPFSEGKAHCLKKGKSLFAFCLGLHPTSGLYNNPPWKGRGCLLLKADSSPPLVLCSAAFLLPFPLHHAHVETHWFQSLRSSGLIPLRATLEILLGPQELENYRSQMEMRRGERKTGVEPWHLLLTHPGAAKGFSKQVQTAGTAKHKWLQIRCSDKNGDRFCFGIEFSQNQKTQWISMASIMDLCINVLLSFGMTSVLFSSMSEPSAYFTF